MSISGGTPFYIKAATRADGLIDYELWNPGGFRDTLVHKAPVAARDEVQAYGRVQNLLPAWQEEVEFRYVDKL